MSIGPSRQFRARQIEDAQYAAHAKRMGWYSDKYVDKATRAAGFKKKLSDSTEDGVIGMQDTLAEAREIRRTPYNPAKGLTTKYDPVSRGYKK